MSDAIVDAKWVAGHRDDPGVRAGVTRDKGVITYCTVGNRASQAWFTLMHVLGYPDVRVYYGSCVDWGKRTDTRIGL